MIDTRPRNTLGQLQIQYKDSDFIKVIEDLKQASTAQIAELIGCNKRIALNRLKTLLETKQTQGAKVNGRWIFTLKE